MYEDDDQGKEQGGIEQGRRNFYAGRLFAFLYELQDKVKQTTCPQTCNSKKLRETPLMKISLFVVCAAAFLTSGLVAADENTQESAPIELSAEQMDQITAGSLLLPNGKTIFANFDNPAPDTNGYLSDFLLDPMNCVDSGALCHPSLTRRSDTAFVTAGHGKTVTPFGNDGPWAATVASPVISCPDC